MPLAMVYGALCWLKKVPELALGRLFVDLRRGLAGCDTSQAALARRADPSADRPRSSAPRPHRSMAATPNSLVDEMLSHSRYALLLRPQLIGNLSTTSNLCGLARRFPRACAWCPAATC